ncbi:hypothetical protein D5086_021279 [Populus alba]|uniref:Uncharacterized protein n=1 Tax=Populus alba TaxID=43335 RepID=A0ACC4BCB2_POPAL
MKLTAEGYFITANSELRNLAKEWLKTTAEGCSVVAVLIATVAFAAAYTVPGGPNQSTGVPVLVGTSIGPICKQLPPWMIMSMVSIRMM